MGTLTIVTNNLQYTKYNYSYGGKTYEGIHVFVTKSGEQSIAPAISETKVSLSNINPSMADPADVIAKTNANMHDYNANNFYGFFYQGTEYPMYVNGTSYWTSTLPENSVMFTDTSPKYWPSFCVKKDGTATIRWFPGKDALLVALPYCECIIASVHALVFSGKCVFNEKVYDNEQPTNTLIMDPDGVNTGTNVRYNPNNGSPASGVCRTALGHKSGNDGVYIMVSTDAGMTCKVLANLMLDLGCDYAVNMDGSSPVQMRIKNGYGANGKVTSNAGTLVHTAVCAYELN